MTSTTNNSDPLCIDPSMLDLRSHLLAFESTVDNDCIEKYFDWNVSRIQDTTSADSAPVVTHEIDALSPPADAQGPLMESSLSGSSDPLFNGDISESLGNEGSSRNEGGGTLSATDISTDTLPTIPHRSVVERRGYISSRSPAISSFVSNEHQSRGNFSTNELQHQQLLDERMFIARPEGYRLPQAVQMGNALSLPGGHSFTPNEYQGCWDTLITQGGDPLSLQHQPFTGFDRQMTKPYADFLSPFYNISPNSIAGNIGNPFDMQPQLMNNRIRPIFIPTGLLQPMIINEETGPSEMLPWSAPSQTTHLISDGQFIYFTGLARNLRIIPSQSYSKKDSCEFHAESIVDIPPIRLRDIQQGDLSRMQLPALNVTGKQFGIKVSVRISVPPYNTHLNKQITIRRSTASSEYVNTYKLLEKIARLFLQFMKQVQNDINVANEWRLFPTGRINVDRVFLLAIIRVAHGSIQPVFGTDV